MNQSLNTKKITFIAMMAAMGNVLSLISIRMAPLVPSIPLGPVTFSLALDLSHIATFIAALFGGPVVGGLTGLIGGIIAAFEFGFSRGNFLTGFGLPIGKALTGIAAGVLMKRLEERGGVMYVIGTILSYIPEALLTVVIFMYLIPLFLPYLSSWITLSFTIQILVKAFVEMIIMGVILMRVMRNRGFKVYVQGLLG
jgi:riboflavin transporter FmnP